MRSTVGVLVLLLTTAAAALAAGPPISPPDFGQVSAADRAAARTALEQFREATPEQCYFEFELQIRPRRGDTRVVPGRLWFGRNAQGPILRLVLDPGAPDERRWLVQGGADPSAWQARAGGVAEPAEVLAPLFPGVELNAFDLQLQFIYWPDENLLSLDRLFGRPTYDVLFRPPPAFAARHPEITGVRVYFDTQFKAPVKTEILGTDGVRQTLTVNDVVLKEHPAIVREVDIRNEATHDTTRFEVRAAALGLDLLPSLFTPGELGADVSPPASQALDRFGP